MRRLRPALVGVLAGGLLCGGVFSAAASAARATFVNCNAQQLTFLFWPQGHGAIASVKFPSYPPPHSEIYKTDPTYAGSSFIAFVDAGGQTSVISACTVANAPFIRTAIPSAQTITATAAVMCDFPQPVQIEAAGQAGGPGTIRVTMPVTTTVKVKVKPKKGKKHKPVFKIVRTTAQTVVLSEQIAVSSSSLTFDSAVCTAGAAPS